MSSAGAGELDEGGIVSREAGVAVGRPVACGRHHLVEREVLEGIDAQVLADLLAGVRRGDELVAIRRVDAVVARTGDRR